MSDSPQRPRSSEEAKKAEEEQSARLASARAAQQSFEGEGPPLNISDDDMMTYFAMSRATSTSVDADASRHSKRSTQWDSTRSQSPLRTQPSPYPITPVYSGSLQLSASRISGSPRTPLHSQSLPYQSTPIYSGGLPLESAYGTTGSPVSPIYSTHSIPVSSLATSSSDAGSRSRSGSVVSNISGVGSQTASGGASSGWSYSDFQELQHSQSLIIPDWPVDEKDREILQQRGITFPGTDEGECIGQGGFGEIWLAVNTASDGTTVTMACKKISLQFYKREGKTLQRAQELLMNEMRAHEMAKHPHVVGVIHIYHLFPQQLEYNQPLTVLIFMDLCDGDLSKALTKPKAVPLPENIACQWFLQMALAVQYLHSIGIAHRDIKPQNILYKRGLIDGTYTFKITDFGLVKIFDEFDVSLQSPAMSTTIVGTEDYMAPEMTDKEEGAEYDTFLTDVYSLGVVLLQCLKLMFKSLIEKFGKDRVHEIHKRVSSKFSDDVKDLLKGMLMFDPNNRLNISQVIDHRWTKQIEYQEYYDMGPNW